MKLQFGSRRRREPRETPRGADAERNAGFSLQIFRLVLPPPLLPQGLRRYGPLGAMLRPLALANLADSIPHRLPESLLFPARSTEDLRLCHRKRCAPNRGEWLLSLAN